MKTPTFTEEMKKAWSQIVAKSWIDPSFKKQLLNNPNQVLEQYGIKKNAKESFKIVENTKEKTHFVLPVKPEGKLYEPVSDGGSKHCYCLGSEVDPR